MSKQVRGPVAVRWASSCCSGSESGPTPRRGVTSSEDIGRILDRAASTAPFERLLAGRDPVRAAHAADAGHAFAAAVLAHALAGPVLLVAPDPRAAESLAAGAAAFLGQDGAELFPAWESLPYEGISPGPLTA